MLEILKLKSMLDKANIPYEYKVYKSAFFPYINNNYQIIINDKDGERLCDAIYSYGSYGYKQNLLEIKGALTLEEKENNSVLGYLTAKEVFKRFKYCYKHNTKYYMKRSKK